MKTKSIIMVSTVIVAILCMATDCIKEPLTELPPETQNGKNTFGCLVEGKLFVKGRSVFGFGQNPLKVWYSKEEGLRICCKSDDPKFVFICLLANNITIGENILTVGNFIGYGSEFDCNNCGEIFITKLDTINKVISGRFNFLGKEGQFYNDTVHYLESDLTVQITEGRFDVKY